MRVSISQIERREKNTGAVEMRKRDDIEWKKKKNDVCYRIHNAKLF